MSTSYFLDRFFAKIEVAENGCWQWTSALSNGYGVINTRMGAVERAHRLMKMICDTEAPPIGMDLRHSCDNRKCVNPEHLSYGTRADNVRDMMERKRHRSQSQTHCKRGHPLFGDNLRLEGAHKRRRCVTCARVLGLQGYHARKKRRQAA